MFICLRLLMQFEEEELDEGEEEVSSLYTIWR